MSFARLQRVKMIGLPEVSLLDPSFRRKPESRFVLSDYLDAAGVYFEHAEGRVCHTGRFFRPNCHANIFEEAHER